MPPCRPSVESSSGAATFINDSQALIPEQVTHHMPPDLWNGVPLMDESSNLPEKLLPSAALRNPQPDQAPPRLAYLVAASPGPPADAEPTLLFESWQVIRRHKGWLIILTSTGTLLAFLLAMLQTPIYQATTALEIQGLNENFLNLREVDPTSSTAYSGSEVYLQTQVDILKDDSLVERVINKMRLEERPAFAYEPSRLSSWRKALGLLPVDKTMTMEQAVKNAQKNFTVNSSPGTRIVRLTYDSPDPQLATEFVNTLATEFIQQNLESRWGATQNTGEWLTKQLQDMKIKLEDSENALQIYAHSAGLVFTDEKNSASEEKLRQMQASLSQAQADHAARQAQFEAAVSGSREALSDEQTESLPNASQAKLTELRRELAELSILYAPTNYKVKRVQAQIAELESAVEKGRNRKLERLRNDYQAAKAREQILQTAYNSQTQLLAQQSEKTTHFSILKREVDTNRGLYEAMLQKVKEAGIASAMSASNIRIVAPGKLPSKPYKPELLSQCALGLFGGGFLGLIFVFIRERADRSIRVPGDLRIHLKVPELGVIPSAKSDPETKQKRLKSTQPKFLSISAAVVAAQDSPSDSPLPKGAKGLSPVSGIKSKGSSPNDFRIELVTWLRDSSMLAECFRAVLTSILFSGGNGNRPKVIVLTSSGPKEGKTTVASNLAIALAEISHRVLLIDGDLRRPRLHQVFNRDNDYGLSDLLRESPPVEESPMTTLVQETSIPGLYLLPSGKANLSIATLLHLTRLREWLACFRQRFDAVVIDTPPMLQLPDARILGRLADAVVLVVRAGQISLDMVQSACQRFEDDRTLVLGTILNDWDPKKGTSYGYGDYYKNYYHYYSKTKGT